MKLVFGVFFSLFPHAQKLVRFFLVTQNKGSFPEWTFLSNTFSLKLNCLSIPPDECALKKHCIWKVHQELAERHEIVGIFALLFLHVSFPSFPCYQRKDFAFLTLPTPAKRRLKGP